MMAGIAEQELVDTPTLDDNRTDEDLVSAVNRGDFDAFEALYRRYRDWIVNLAFRFTGDRDSALDILQETFLYFVKKFPGFELRAQLKTFFYPAVRNLSISARRKTQRYQATATDLAEIESAIAAQTPSGENEAIASALRCLPEKQREVLWLRFVDGLSLEEVAEALSLPLGTVKSRLHNALQTLREDPDTKSYFEQ